MVLFFLEYILLAFVSLACCTTNMTQTSLVLAAHAASTTSNFSDHLALMAFKSRVTSDPSRALATWSNQSVPMCQWQGVSCGLKGSRHGRVVALDLGELNLVGTVTPALGNLTYLRLLNLSSNHFHGILPPELGNLHDLEDLQLSYNSIEGQIPSSLSNCSHLVDISINANKLQGVIPGEFSSLHNLQILHLESNALTGTIPSSIGNLVNLKYLALTYNNLTGEIPVEMGSLVSLGELDLGYNLFYGSIPASLGNLSALTVLTIPNTNLEHIPPLQGLSSLRILELGNNKLTGIPSWLGNLSSLVYLSLQANSLVGQIPESLGNLELLQILSLDQNNLSGSVPQSIGNLHDLTELYLSKNALEGSLPHSMFNLSSLELLLLDFNSFTGDFPPDMGSKLSNLKLIFASINQFHGSLPSSICNASMLQAIEIVTTFMSGTIPQCLGTHQKDLSVVFLADSYFEARNDADWGFLTGLTNSSNMRKLALSSNKLEGVLPNSIGNLSTQMKFLTIEDNKITGPIPEGIGNLINLNELDMGNNMLVSAIPISLSKLKKSNRLSLTNNVLSGPIPVSLGNLTELVTLILGTNVISGAIPSSLSNCPLEVLDLSHNNLSGPIPKELFFISTLSKSMNLAHNSLSGPFPSELENLKNLNEIDLSNNMISGEIPASIGECQSLENFNVSVNMLQGAIPTSLGNLRGLLVVDLSYNNLSGTIPEELGKLPGLSSLNLSFNKLQGEVPKDGVFLNATAILVTGNGGLCGGIPQLKLTPCSIHTNKRPSRELAIIISVCSAFLFVAIFALALSFYRKAQKTKENLQKPVIDEQHMRLSYVELANATDGFSSENLIGAGSFGSVYKGRMGGNEQHVAIAVKVLNLMQRGATQSFIAECETLRMARHRNLVKILTVCSSIDFKGCDFKALVYEFLPNGNLDQWLHQHIMEDGEHKALDLIGRLHIAIDVASSLDYLHQYKPTPIIHCDLKPSNILLDGDMVAHVGDFGLARFLRQDTYQSTGWASMRGSIGYAAPEYGLGNEVSTQGDVYSYGILLLEMFTGKRPTDSEFGEAIGLRKYVQMAFPARVSSIVDQQLLTETENKEASISYSGSISNMRIPCIASILQVGMSCSHETPADRPMIGDALTELQAIRDKFHKNLPSSPVKEHHEKSTDTSQEFSSA